MTQRSLSHESSVLLMSVCLVRRLYIIFVFVLGVVGLDLLASVPTGRWCGLVVVNVVLFMSVILDGAGAGIKGDFCAAAEATASASASVMGVILGVVADPIAWNTTNTLYEFFVVVLVLGLVGVLVLSVVIAGAIIFVGIGLYFLALLVNAAAFSVGVLRGAGRAVGAGVIFIVVDFGVVVVGVGDLCCLVSPSVIAVVTSVVVLASSANVVFVACLASAGVDGVGFECVIFVVFILSAVCGAGGVGLYFLALLLLLVLLSS